MREVDDALREEELLESLKRHGVTAAIVVVAGLAALGGYLWWDTRTTAAQGANSERFEVALARIDAGDLPAGAGELGPLAKDTTGSGATARLTLAAILQEQGKNDEAARAFAAIAADSSVPQALRDFALLREVAINFDKLQPQQVIDRLKGLAVLGNPYFPTAAEMTAMAYMRMNQNAKAGPLFAAVAKDKEAPESLRARARQLAGMLGVDAINDVAQAAGAENDAAWGIAPGGPAPQTAPPPAQPNR